jgi:hypothetical protein
MAYLQRRARCSSGEVIAALKQAAWA